MSLLDNSKSLEYIDHYCNDASYKKNLAKNTLEAYKSDLTVFLKWLISRNLPIFPSRAHSSLKSVNVFGMNLQRI